MGFKEITDQKEIEELERLSKQSKYRAVSPTESKRLDLMSKIQQYEQQPSEAQPDESSFLSRLPQNLLAAEAQLGQSILNAPHNIASSLARHDYLSPETANKIPAYGNYDYAKMLNLPEGGMDYGVRKAIELSPSILIPAARLGKVGELIGAIPKIGKGLAGLISRALPQAAIGAATGEGGIDDAMMYGGAQAAAEGLALPFKGIGKLAEFARPVKYTDKLAKDIANKFQASKAEAEKLYEKALSGNEGLGLYEKKANPITYLHLGEDELKDWYSPKLKKLHKNFLNEPTLENAHVLQSELGRASSKPATSSVDAKMNDSYKFARDLLRDDMTNALAQYDAKAATHYQQASDFYRDIVSPFRSTKALRLLSEGKAGDMKPAQLQKALSKAIREKDISPEHYLAQALNPLEQKISRGEWMQNVLGAGLGGTIGSGIGYGLGGGLGAGAGGTAGAFAGKTLTPAMLDVIQHPITENMASRLHRLLVARR